MLPAIIEDDDGDDVFEATALLLDAEHHLLVEMSA